jgi:alkanesulfonate monooxygenase SsuD/methylene tetrahydromethanopterin reductase-like flavin-dependent oxidoreductase (luciferase family)
MKIGMVLPMNEADGPGAGRWPRIRQLALLAEAGGIDSLWVYDHLIFRLAGEDEDGIHEAWTLLSARAAVTERVELGTIVLGTGFRPPALTAKMAATLDEVSKARGRAPGRRPARGPRDAPGGRPMTDVRAGR